MIVAERMRKRRNKLGLKQKELACRMEVPQSLVSQYETGARHPLPDALNNIASCLNTTTDYLLGRTEIDEPLSPYELEVVDFLRSLTDKPSVEEITLALWRAKNLPEKPVLRRGRK